MRARVLTLRFDPVLEAFDDGPLREFLKHREAVKISEHFFVRNHVPYLAVLVTYRLDPTVPESPSDGKARSSKPGWRSRVSAADLPLFNTLREWRAERASREGIPPYLVCTNKQLAAIVTARPQSLTRLGAIDGIRKVKLRKYGQDLLALLARPRNEERPPDAMRSPPAAPSGAEEDRPESGSAEGSPDGRPA